MRSDHQIIVLGSVGVGKTALVANLGGGVFEESYLPTAGYDLSRLDFPIEDRDPLLEIFDTSGGDMDTFLENFDSSGRDIDTFLEDFDRSAAIVDGIQKDRQEKCELKDYFNLVASVRDWKAESSQNTGTSKRYPIMVLCNMVDKEENRQVNTLDGYNFAREHGCHFLETSGKKCIKVETAFRHAIQLSLSLKPKLKPTDPSMLLKAWEAFSAVWKGFSAIYCYVAGMLHLVLTPPFLADTSRTHRPLFEGTRENIDELEQLERAVDSIWKIVYETQKAIEKLQQELTQLRDSRDNRE
ncbi:P-loop containing nucleoside triphosphate hydrolase protein [Xylaria venustula]|nr:P-loop containing nucleoside triphosphate hydrolase protein [Xylaria venustula]